MCFFINFIMSLSFAKFFKKYRLLSQIATLDNFGDLLANEGIIYENSIFSRWQCGKRIPKHRRTILVILKIFIKKGGIKNIKEANNFLESSGQGYLTDSEKQTFFS